MLKIGQIKAVALAVIICLMSGLVAPGVASADPGGSPKVFYSCYSPNFEGTFVVHHLSRCNEGVITIYTSYDDKSHGQIQVEDGKPYFNRMTFSDFVHAVLRAVASSAARKLWSYAKKYWDKGEDPDLPVDLPVG